MDNQQSPQQDVKSGAISFVDKLNTPLSTLWKESKIFLIIFGILILIVKFRDIIIDILINSSKNILDDAQKKDAKLRSEENTANTDANQLIEEAKKLSENKSTIDENWNKK